jgi:hypothetical protein
MADASFNLPALRLRSLSKKIFRLLVQTMKKRIKQCGQLTCATEWDDAMRVLAFASGLGVGDRLRGALCTSPC